MIVVQKYGGSSVADVPRLRSVARRVVDTVHAGHQVVVVVSAMGNTTSELLNLAHEVSPRPGRRELDLLISVGERISMTLLAMAVEDLGVPAASFTGSQSGIITDENHVAASVVEVKPQRIREALGQGKVVIVAGFQGVSRAREVTTLGRGGSDTTAVVLAAALGADHCEICSDVDGVYTADPRVVPEARRLDELPLDAAWTLTRAGAKVVQAEAVALARRLGVRIDAAATAAPPGSGTHLPPGPTPSQVVGITADTELDWWVVAQDWGPVGAARAWWTQDGAVHLLLDRRNLHGALELAGGARQGPVATVSAVGRQVVEDPACLRSAVDALASLAPKRWWANGDAFHALVDREVAAEAQRRLHQALVATG